MGVPLFGQEHWFLDLRDDPIVVVPVRADHHTARARVATAEEKPELLLQ